MRKTHTSVRHRNQLDATSAGQTQDNMTIQTSDDKDGL